MYFFGWGIIHDEPKFANDGGGGLYGVIRNRHKRGSDLEEFARHELARRWVNRHAFYTNLYGIGWVNISMECAHFIELAFMKPPAAHAAEDPAWPDNHVAAAAQWIDYSGPALSRELKSPSGAKTVTGFPAGISFGDWRRWMEGFRGAGNETARQEETRELAGRTADIMDLFEEKAVAVQGGAAG
ncbi:hypothetical protein PG988_005920 [Apiospora saccharicola]